MWRWVAMTLMPDEFAVLCLDDNVKWPEASLASHLYFGIEDALLWVTLHIVLESGYEHLSLHMDGFRLDPLTMASICKEQYPDRASEMASLTTDQVEKLFCDLCSKELDARTGFKIHFRVEIDRSSLRC